METNDASTFDKWTQNHQKVSDLESMQSKTRKMKQIGTKIMCVDQLADSINHCLQLLASGILDDAEFVAAYILLFIQQKYCDSWLSGLRKESIPVCSCTYPSSIPLYPSNNNNIIHANDNDELYLLKGSISLSTKERTKLLTLWKRNRIQQPITLITMFQHCLLYSVPNHVYDSIVNWGNGKRPYKLMFELPSAKEVLELQCSGRRCLTVFVKKEELGLLLKDPYPPFESRDVLSFLFHDLQHMERFVDSRFYCEQIGVLKLFRLWMEGGVFKKYDPFFEEDLNHAISDMNACCVHCIGFLKSKWKQAEWRLLHNSTDPKESETTAFTQEEENHFDELFETVLQEWNVPEQIRASLKSLCKTHTRITKTDSETIREYFHHYGRDHICLPFDLVS